MSSTHVTCTINGDQVEFLCQGDQTLLDALRDVVGLMGVKEGCATGDCGACSVILDGRLTCSCLVLAPEADGTAILTVEGLAGNDGLHPLQETFLEGRRSAVRRYAPPGSWWQGRRCWIGTPIPPRNRCAMPSPETCAGAQAMTRSCGPSWRRLRI